MAQQNKDYWFPAKRYGYGWGMPRRWQGWAVMAAYIAVVAMADVFFPARTHAVGFSAIVAGATLALIGICRIKGEPPGWRWG